MRVNDFDFDLPESLIAKYPLPQRSASRLLSINSESGVLGHKQFRDIKDMLVPGDLLVFNNTRVIPARLLGHKASGGRVEVMIERMLGEKEAKAHIRASKSPKQGTRIFIDRTENAGDGEGATGSVSAGINGAELEVTGRDEGLFLVKVRSDVSFPKLLEQYGCMPLPPYIDRAEEGLDRDRYQTVFNKVPGAVAAPTAGLHFDQTLLDVLADKGVEFAFVTLHVGAGTFQPVRVENIDNHKMHKEYLEVGKECCLQIAAAKARGNKVVAVGTTAVRALETAARQAMAASESEDVPKAGKITPYKGDTEIFIYPGYDFSVVDTMITNFHLPKSTLLMLVSAFAGRENILCAYQAAIAEKYRFFSYGDAMILHGRQQAEHH